jgi:hypothetical protein
MNMGKMMETDDRQREMETGPNRCAVSTHEWTSSAFFGGKKYLVPVASAKDAPLKYDRYEDGYSFP